MRCRFVEVSRISINPAEPNVEHEVILKHKHGTEERIKGERSGNVVTFTHKTYVSILFVSIHLAKLNASYVQLDTDETKFQMKMKRRLRKTITTEEVPLALKSDVGSEHKFSLLPSR